MSKRKHRRPPTPEQVLMHHRFLVEVQHPTLLLLRERSEWPARIAAGLLMLACVWVCVRALSDEGLLGNGWLDGIAFLLAVLMVPLGSIVLYLWLRHWPPARFLRRHPELCGEYAIRVDTGGVHIDRVGTLTWPGLTYSQPYRRAEGDTEGTDDTSMTLTPRDGYPIRVYGPDHVFHLYEWLDSTRVSLSCATTS